MFEGVIVIALILLGINLFLLNKMKFESNDKPRNLEHVEIPKSLGIREEIILEKNLASMQGAMDADLKEKIKILFYRDPKNQNVSEYEFELRYFELQRYFIMCSLLKDVPMFSDEVDEVWHTFILSTRDYDTFCHRFMGEFLHHNPATTRTPNPHGRAWFDLIYTQLFKFTAFSGMTWGAFFRHPLSEKQIQELRNSSVDDLKNKYFRAGANEIAVDSLIAELKRQVEISFEKGTSDKKRPFTPEKKVPLFEQAPFFAQAMIFFSLYYGDEYLVKMGEVQQGFQQTTTSSSACGTGTTNIDISSCGSNCSTGGDGGSGCSGSSCGGGCGGD